MNELNEMAARYEARADRMAKELGLQDYKIHCLASMLRIIRDNYAQEFLKVFINETLERAGVAVDGLMEEEK